MPTTPRTSFRMQMWFWLPPALFTARVHANISVPPHQAHRVIWKELDVPTEWARVVDDFPGVNSSVLAVLSGWEDLRYTTDWLRLLIMYAHGGTWCVRGGCRLCRHGQDMACAVADSKPWRCVRAYAPLQLPFLRPSAGSTSTRYSCET